MVRITGTHGKLIDVQLLGVGEVIRKLRQQGIDITNNVDLAVVKSATLIEEELKLSIAGKKVEPQSVDTGELVDSITVMNVKPGYAEVGPEKRNYPGSDVDTVQTMTFMEYGTSRGISPRRHIRNTVARNKDKVRDKISNAVKVSVAKF